MNTEVQTANTQKALATSAALTPGREEILADAIVIPRILLMQGLSDLVAEGKAVMGEMLRSNTHEVVGKPESPVEFIPLTYNLTWVLSEKVGQKYEYRSSEPLTPQNNDLPWDFTQNGTEWKRTKSLNLYALLTKDISAEKSELAKVESGDLPDPDKALLPVLISFRSTSFKAGQDIMTHFAKARKFNLPGHVSRMMLKCTKEKNDLGTYYIFRVENVGKTSPEDLKLCDYWRNLVGSGKVQVDEEVESTDTKTDTTRGTQF